MQLDDFVLLESTRPLSSQPTTTNAWNANGAAPAELNPLQFNQPAGNNAAEYWYIGNPGGVVAARPAEVGRAIRWADIQVVVEGA